MAEFLLAAAGFVLAMVALGLVRILRGPGEADSLMAAQLLGTGGIAALLLLGAATGAAAVVDVALMETSIGGGLTGVLLIGVWSLAPEANWGGRPGLRQDSDPNGILGYAARVLPPIGIIVGAYIFWVGADYPGGKFQGATILAAMWLLIMMAGLADAPPISRTWQRIGLVIGPLVFIAIGLAGVVTAGNVFAYPDGLAKPLIIAIELALLPSLTLVLGLLMLGSLQRGPQP